MTEHPIHDFINIWRDSKSYLDYCACCKVIRHTNLGRVKHYSPKMRMPYPILPDLKRRFDLMRGFKEAGQPMMVTVMGDFHIGSK